MHFFKFLSLNKTQIPLPSGGGVLACIAGGIFRVRLYDTGSYAG